MPTIIFILVFTTTIISFFYYKNYKSSIYRYFFYFLFWTFLVELIYNVILITYLYTGKTIFNKNIFYNINIIVTFLFLIFFYFKLLRNKVKKKIVLFFFYLFILFLIFNHLILKENFTDTFNSKNLIVGAIFFLITLLLFLVEIINNEKIVFNIKKSFIFWISVGLLLFYIGIIPIMISKKYLNYNLTYTNTLIVLNFVMYGSFIIGFIKSDPKYNY